MSCSFLKLLAKKKPYIDKEQIYRYSLYSCVTHKASCPMISVSPSPVICIKAYPDSVSSVP